MPVKKFRPSDGRSELGLALDRMRLTQVQFARILATLSGKPVVRQKVNDWIRGRHAANAGVMGFVRLLEMTSTEAQRERWAQGGQVDMKSVWPSAEAKARKRIRITGAIVEEQPTAGTTSANFARAGLEASSQVSETLGRFPGDLTRAEAGIQFFKQLASQPADTLSCLVELESGGFQILRKTIRKSARPAKLSALWLAGQFGVSPERIIEW